MFNSSKKMIGAIAVAAASFGTVSVASAQTSTGPDSSQSPYVVPVLPGVQTRSILTVGDAVNNKPDGTPYRMVGIPDGMGAYDNGDGTFTVLMNHELGFTQGVVRAHGAKGAFVSKYTVRKNDLGVVKGEDLIQNVATWNMLTNSYNAPTKGIAIGRLCSADLPGPYAFARPFTGEGYDGRIFLSGEEVGSEGRLFGHVLNGTSYELPHHGKFSWENALTHPSTGKKTVVVGTDDSTGGQVYVYVGSKMKTGNPVERAGLVGGQLYGIKVPSMPIETDSSAVFGAPFVMQPMGNVANKTGVQLENESTQTGVTKFLRPEDGHWDTKDRNRFYFVTTNAFNRPSRLWVLDFKNINKPEMGGTISMLLKGNEGQQMLDNITADSFGRVVMQEDPGNQDYLAKIRSYDLRTGTLTTIAEHDPNRFLPDAPDFLTRDEESSGIIDVSDILGEGVYLINVQAHYATDVETVQGGQLMAMYYPVVRRPSRFPYNPGRPSSNAPNSPSFFNGQF
jgi:hypothetical protein